MTASIRVTTNNETEGEEAERDETWQELMGRDLLMKVNTRSVGTLFFVSPKIRSDSQYMNITH